MNRSEVVGTTFGLWVVVEHISGRHVRARCACGVVKIVRLDTLKFGQSRSCGCSKVTGHWQSCIVCGAPVWITGRRKKLNSRFCSLSCSVKDQHRKRIEAEPVGARFARFVRLNGECWEWSGAVNLQGYGTFMRDGRVAGPRASELAHRVSWTLINGPIPDGLFVCHKCDNPPCVRPDHLFLGTPAANNRDRCKKGRCRHPGHQRAL